MNQLKSKYLYLMIEVLAVFALFAAYGWEYAPGINESHYLTKAKHFWDSSWCENDLFVASQDAHIVYFGAIGWLCNFFSLASVAWIGRIAGWLVLAYAWVRLSRCLFDWIGSAILTAWIFAALCLHVPMAGEWVIGGVEGKVFSFAFVFLAIAAAINQQYFYSWVYCGLAIAFHAVIGVWASAGMIFVRLFCIKNIRPCKTEMGAALIGILLSLAGIIPGLMLSGDIPKDVDEFAVSAQVTMRLSHHLMISEFSPQAIVTFVVASLGWMLLMQRSNDKKMAVVHRFVFAMLSISLIGTILNWLMSFEQFEYATGKLLRFYWFRMSDIAIPMVLSFQLTEILARNRRLSLLSAIVFACIGLVLVADVVHRNYTIIADGRPGADRQSMPSYPDDPQRTYETWQNWVQVCQWIRENTDEAAVFITPRQQQTFNWYAHRAQVANWKDAPQDASGLVEWLKRMNDLYGGWNEQWGLMWKFDEQSRRFVSRDEELLTLANRYGADYLVVPQRYVDSRAANGVPVTFEQVYPEDEDARETYVVFKLPVKK